MLLLLLLLLLQVGGGGNNHFSFFTLPSPTQHSELKWLLKEYLKHWNDFDPQQFPLGLPPSAEYITVLRDDVWKKIPTNSIVRGEIVELAAGEKAPCRMIGVKLDLALLQATPNIASVDSHFSLHHEGPVSARMDDLEFDSDAESIGNTPRAEPTIELKRGDMCPALQQQPIETKIILDSTDRSAISVTVPSRCQIRHFKALETPAINQMHTIMEALEGGNIHRPLSLVDQHVKRFGRFQLAILTCILFE